MMKSILSFLFAAVIITLCGCKANYPVAQQGGKEYVAYLLFVSSSNSHNADISVTIDETTKFDARTVKARKSNRRGTQYTVQPGKRKIVVYDKDGQKVYDKYVFLSTQEVKTITLP